MNYELEENCYVVVRGRDDNCDAYMNLMEKRHDFVMFPESSMRLIDTTMYLPYQKSIITENPFLIASYPKNKVWILSEGNWVHPDYQTFGCSVENIMSNIIGYKNSIPILPLIKIKELVGGLPKECKTYQDVINLELKNFSEFKVNM